jgi:hypothetical protein
MIKDGENGLLADFFKPEEFAAKAVPVLQDPAAFRPLGRAAEKMIKEKYSLEAVLPRMLELYEEAHKLKGEPPRIPPDARPAVKPITTHAAPPHPAAPRTPAGALERRRSPFFG